MPVPAPTDDPGEHSSVNVHGRQDGGIPAAGRAPEVLHVVSDAVPGALAGIRSEVSAWARTAGLPADLLVDLLLAVGEAAANVVDHAYSGRPPGPLEVDIRLVSRHGRLVVAARIADRGRWRPGWRSEEGRGRGLPMIRALAAQLEVAATARGTEVQLELAVPG